MGTKLQRYIKAKRDPAGAIVAYLSELDEMVNKLAKEAIKQMATEAMTDLGVKFDRIKANLPKMGQEITDLLMAEIRKHPEKYRGFRGFQGERGASVKGEKGDKGDDGYTPVADVDFHSKASMERIIKTLIPKMPDLLPVVQKVFKKYKMPLPPANKIARALETLQGKERLDYNALKNLPEIPKKGASTKGMLRGGGEKVEYYDLSALCDGVTKVFTIPRNKRVVMVLGTDSPAGQYRQGVDYTGSGTTTLTLTGAVMAPSQGATLHILYVP